MFISNVLAIFSKVSIIGDFTRFKWRIGVVAKKTPLTITPEKATNHLLECIEYYKAYPTYKSNFRWGKSVGRVISYRSFELFWGKFSCQVERCILLYSDKIKYKQLIVPTNRKAEYLELGPLKKKYKGLFYINKPQLSDGIGFTRHNGNGSIVRIKDEELIKAAKEFYKSRGNRDFTQGEW